MRRDIEDVWRRTCIEIEDAQRQARGDVEAAGEAIACARTQQQYRAGVAKMAAAQRQLEESLRRAVPASPDYTEVERLSMPMFFTSSEQLLGHVHALEHLSLQGLRDLETGHQMLERLRWALTAEKKAFDAHSAGVRQSLEVQMRKTVRSSALDKRSNYAGNEGPSKFSNDDPGASQGPELHQVLALQVHGLFCRHSTFSKSVSLGSIPILNPQVSLLYTD